MTSRMSSGSSRADIAVEPTRSQNITVSWRRSAASGFGAGRGRPILDRLDHDELPDRAQHFPAVAEDDAEFLQVLVGRLGKHRDIDAILGEAPSVFGHAEPFEPIRDIEPAVVHELSSSSNAFASFKSSVSLPSVNQP